MKLLSTPPSWGALRLPAAAPEEGGVLSETMIEGGFSEVENQYLRGSGRKPQKPNF